MAEELHLNIVSTAESKGLTKAAKDLKATKGEADKLSKSFEEMGENAEDAGQDINAATKAVRSHGDQIRHLREEYERTTKRIAELDAQMLDTNTGDKSGLKKDLRERRAWLAELQRIAKGMEKSSGISIGLGKRDPGPPLGMPKLDFSGMTGGGSGTLIAGVVGVVALAAPAIGAVVAGAVVGAVGAGGVVGGVVAAAQDPRVKTAWEDLTAGVSFKTFGGDKLAGPVVGAIGILKQGLQDLNLDEVLGKAGPGIENLAHGLVDFATNAMPGVMKVMDNLDEITDVIGAGMGNVGDAFSDMLTDMMESEGTLEGLQAIFDVLAGTLRFVGEATKFLGGAFHGAGRMSAEASGVMEDVFAKIPIVGYPAQKFMESINDTTENLVGNGEDYSKQAQMMSTTSAHLNERLQGTAGAMAEIDKNALKATAALSDFYKLQLGIVDSNIAFEQGLDDLSQSLKDNGTSLDIDGQKGRDNMTAIQTAIKDAQKARDDLAATGKIEEANAAYQKMVDRIRDVLKQAGLTKQEIDKLVKPYEFTITANLITKGSLPKYVSSNFSAPAQDAMGAGRRAGGGPITAGQPYLVGEHGPELVVPDRNGFVIPNGGGAGRGEMWAAPIQYTPSGNAMWDTWFEQFRAEVQGRGGTLAVVGVRA